MAKTKKRKRGHPVVADPRTRRIVVQLTGAESELLDRLVERSKARTLSDFMRARLLAEKAP